MKVIAATLLFTSALVAQDVKPKPHVFFNKENITLFSADALVRSLDAESTRSFMTDPCHCFHEAVLPNAIVSSTPRMYAFSLGFSAGVVAMSYLAHKTHHHKIERMLPVLDIVLDGEAVVGNYRLKTPAQPINWTPLGHTK